MLDQFIAGVLLAAITGLAGIAWGHPRFYFQKLFKPSLCTVIAVGFGIAMWDAAFFFGESQLASAGIATPEATQAFRALIVPIVPFTIVFVLTIGYLAFLRWLSRHMKPEHTVEPQRGLTLNSPFIRAIDVAILRLLTDEPAGMYGLEIVRASEGTLSRLRVYIVLGRLEETGFIRSKLICDSDPQGLTRLRYFITVLGQRALSASELLMLFKVEAK